VNRASDDLSHDTHLRAALRHAPDHALAPPAGVSQTILNAARQVHRPMRAAATAAPVVRVTVARPRALAWLHQWFASPRLAGGLATGLVAALGLGLWFDLAEQPLIEPAPVGAQSEARSRPDATGPSGADANDTRVAQAPPPAPAPVAEPETARAKRAPRTADTGQRKVERAERPAPAPAPEPAAAPRDDSSAREAEAMAKASPPAVAAPPAPAPMADTAGAPQPGAPTAAAEIARLAQLRDSSSRSEQRMLSAAGRAAAAAAPETARTSASEAVVAASPAFALLRRARSELNGGHARWAWTPPGSPLMAPFDDAGQAWLARVVQAAHGRWTDAAERGALGDAIEVRWWRNDWPQATLRIEADGVRWIEHGGRIRHAPLDAATLQRLRSP
jgi:hypothetical protein